MIDWLRQLMARYVGIKPRIRPETQALLDRLYLRTGLQSEAELQEVLGTVVPHPRFGTHPRPSGYYATNGQILELFADNCIHYSYFFVETILPVNERKMTTIFRPSCYVDRLLKCIDCDRWFIFFAQEHRYWLEELGFYGGARCVRCVECRRKTRKRKRKRPQ